MIVTPVDIPPAPEPPNRADRTTFNARAVAWADYQKDELVPGVNAAADATNANAQHAEEQAIAASGYAASASEASEIALGAGNFKGIWINMTGPLNKPASVKHQGRFWLLLNNLANVTTSEPGVTADWTSLDAGTVSARINGNTDAVAGVYYIFGTIGITLSYLPGDWMQDDVTHGRNESGGICFLNWGAYQLCNDTPESPMKMPKLGKFHSVFNGGKFS